MDRPLRFSFFRLVFLASFGVLSLRLFDIQVLKHNHYLSLAQEQHYQFLDIAPSRGEILASDGARLAANETDYLLFADPHQVSDIKKTVNTLAPLLWEQQKLANEASLKLQEQSGVKPPQGLPTDKKKEFLDFSNTLTKELGQNELYWVALAHYVDPKTKDAISNLKLSGLFFQEEAKRVYPESLLASHLLGFVGKDTNALDFGYFGLEGFYNTDLSGKNGLGRIEKDANGNPIPVAQSLLSQPVDGRDLVLTINRELQYMLEKDLKNGVAKYQAEGGTFILLDPKTGAILAMANFPDFSPAFWQSYLGKETDVSKISAFTNSAISQNYEPGSVFKPITMAMALENGSITPDTIFDDSGPLTVAGSIIRTWDNKYHGKIDMARILQLSDNTGAAWVGLKLGVQKFYSGITAFGFGKPTGVDLQGEARGIVKPKKEWRDIDVATAAFGQGIAITPLQLVQAYTAFANNGVMMKPYLAQKITTSDKSIEIKPQKAGQPISSNTARIISEMLRSVVDKGEFNWYVRQQGLEKWDLGGKTGTAQIPINGRYDPSQTEVTFIGLAPVSSPKFILLVKLDKPKTSTFSADTVVPLWLEMVKKLVVYFKIPPRY